MENTKPPTVQVTLLLPAVRVDQLKQAARKIAYENEIGYSYTDLIRHILERSIYEAGGAYEAGRDSLV